MSEASRQRWLHVHNRLEELAWKYGPVEEDEPPGIDADPSWGPVGSLAEQLLSPEAYAHIVALDEEYARMRGEAPGKPLEQPPAAETSSEPPAQNRVLDASEALLRIDRYGETPVYGCPLCGEESAKASVALGVWHCTACDYWGKVQAARRDPKQLPTVPLHDV